MNYRKYDGHTPAPWISEMHVNAGGDKGAYYPIETVPGETDGYVARVYAAGKATAGGACADAELIADAPMLLQRCKDLESLLQTTRNTLNAIRGETGDDHIAIVRMLNAITRELDG